VSTKLLFTEKTTDYSQRLLTPYTKYIERIILSMVRSYIFHKTKKSIRINYEPSVKHFIINLNKSIKYNRLKKVIQYIIYSYTGLLIDPNLLRLRNILRMKKNLNKKLTK